MLHYKLVAFNCKLKIFFPNLELDFTTHKQTHKTAKKT